MAKFILAATLAATLAACGGGGGGSSQTDAKLLSAPDPHYTSIAACTPRTVTVALLGDSTQAGYDSGNRLKIAAHNPGVELQAIMDRVFGIGAVSVTDYGVGGTLAYQAPHVSADVVVANYGINDAKYGVTIADYTASMKAIGATLIETPNPVYGQAWDVSPYSTAAESLGLPVADVYTFVLLQADGQTHEHDGVHPDDNLYREIVDAILAPAVESQVAPLRCVRG